MFDDLPQAQLNVIGAIVTIAVVLSSFLLLSKRGRSETISDNDWSSVYATNDDTSEESKSDKQQLVADAPPELKNVFDVKQNGPGVSKPEENGGTNEKPFQSSYYYAHNNPKSNGGYKDGLKAEDYVMNKPRLLQTTVKEKENATATTSTQAATLSKDSIAIQKYLWDDDGNDDGIAKIIIDSLPSSKGCDKSAYIPWQEGGIVSKDNVKAKLVGLWKDGLIVQIRSRTTNDDPSYKRYHLLVPRMFGEVEDIKLILKTKKLIVKLNKKKKKENLKAWPQLPSKIVKPTQITEADVFNQDLFSESNDMNINTI